MNKNNVQTQDRHCPVCMACNIEVSDALEHLAVHHLEVQEMIGERFSLTPFALNGVTKEVLRYLQLHPVPLEDKILDRGLARYLRRVLDLTPSNISVLVKGLRRS